MPPRYISRTPRSERSTALENVLLQRAKVERFGQRMADGGMNRTVRFRLMLMLDTAQDLCEPANGERNREYERGQAELICDYFAISQTAYRDEIMEIIGGTP